MPDPTTADLLGTAGFRQRLQAAVSGFPKAEEALADLGHDTEQLLEDHKAKNTLQSYKTRLKVWHQWCDQLGLPPLRHGEEQAASQLVLFISWLAKNGRPTQDDTTVEDADPYAVSTMRLTLTAIGFEYNSNGLPSPAHSEDVKRIMAAYARLHGKPQEQAHALTLEQLHAICAVLDQPDDPAQAARDHLMLLLRTDPKLKVPRSQVVKLRWEDLEPADDGLWFVTPNGNQHLATRRDDPLLDAASAAIHWRVMAGDNPLVFPGDPIHKPMDSENARKNILIPHVNDTRRSDGTPVSFIGGLPRGQNKLTDQDRRRVVQRVWAPPSAARRDTALVTLGWWALLRASEMSTLLWRDLTVTDDTVDIYLTGGTKEDQFGRGERVHVKRNGGPTDPGTALEAWRAALEQELGRPLTDDDPVFWALNTSQPTCNHYATPVKGRTRYGITYEAINNIIKKAAANADLEPDPNHRISSHMLRAGGATEMTAAGASPDFVANHGRWKPASSSSRYMRPNPTDPRTNPTADLTSRRTEANENKVLERERRLHSGFPQQAAEADNDDDGTRRD